MRHINLLVLLLLGLLSLNACSDDDDDNPVLPPETINLEGKWMVKEINFTSNVKQWENGTYSNAMDLFGWAPYMFGSAAGFEFTGEEYTDAQTNTTGKVFKMATGSSYGGSGKIYWVWNMLDNGKAFEVVQLNKQMPPYDFSMSKTTMLKQTTIEGKRFLEFTTTLVSLDQDKLSESSNPMTRAKVAATATFILEETTGEFNTDLSPALKLNGAELKMPEYADPNALTKKNLLGTAWLLKAGSKVYDAGFVAGDPVYEFTKLITLHFESESVFKFRYTFPMGIVTTKESTWEFNDDTYVFTYEKPAGAMAGTSMKFVWKASYVTEEGKNTLVLDLQEVVDNVGQDSEKKLDLTGVDKALLKREFTSVPPEEVDDLSKTVSKENYTIFK